MKKPFSLVLGLLLFCGLLSGCGGTAGSSTPAGPSAPESSASAGVSASAGSSPAAGPLGYWEGRRYINETIGLHFTLPGEWSRYTDEQLGNLAVEEGLEAESGAYLALLAMDSAGSNVMLMLYDMEAAELDPNMSIEDIFEQEYEEGDLDTGAEGVTADPPYYLTLEGIQFYVIDVEYSGIMAQRTMYGISNGYLINIAVTATSVGTRMDTIMKYFG